MKLFAKVVFCALENCTLLLLPLGGFVCLQAKAKECNVRWQKKLN